MLNLIQNVESIGLQCEAGSIENSAAWQELKQLALECFVLARHNHIRGEGDVCKHCGYDLRHPVHFRLAAAMQGEKKAQ